MKFNIIFIFIFLTSCASNITKIENRSPYNSKGFAYIYNDQDYEKKIISFKLDNAKEQISVYNLKMNSLIKIINQKTKESLTLNNYKRIKYPDFYKILITEKVAKKLDLDPKLPLVEFAPLPTSAVSPNILITCVLTLVRSILKFSKTLLSVGCVNE